VEANGRTANSDWNWNSYLLHDCITVSLVPTLVVRLSISELLSLLSSPSSKRTSRHAPPSPFSVCVCFCVVVAVAVTYLEKRGRGVFALEADARGTGNVEGVQCRPVPHFTIYNASISAQSLKVVTITRTFPAFLL
jgi:hypothetical protein